MNAWIVRNDPTEICPSEQDRKKGRGGKAIDSMNTIAHTVHEEDAGVLFDVASTIMTNITGSDRFLGLRWRARVIQIRETRHHDGICFQVRRGRSFYRLGDNGRSLALC
jgi:hypothetical protein